MDLSYRKQYKMAYPDNRIFFISFNGNEFVFRDITKKEFIDFKELATNNMDFEDLICQLAVISPKDIDFYNTGMAGLSATLFPLIIQNSDLDGKAFATKLSVYQRFILSSPEEQHKAMIKAVFPEFSYDIIDTWPYDKFIKNLARAEFVLTKIHGKKDATLTVIDEEQSIKQQQNNETDEINDISWNLMEKGIDPILSLWGLKIDKNDEIPRPFIGSYKWKDEGIMNAIAGQIHKRISQ